MSEQNEEKGGSVVLPGAVGLAGIAGAKILSTSASNKLALSALDGTLETAGKDAAKVTALQDAAKAALSDTKNAAAANGFDAARNIQGLKDGATVTEATFTKVGEAHTVSLKAGERELGTITLDKLTGPAKDLAAKGTVTGDDLKKLTDGGQKSWVNKTAASAENAAAKAVRAADGYKKAGGTVWGAFKNAKTGSKIGIAAGTVAAVGGLGIAVKNMFSGPSHTSRVEAERSAQTQAQPAR